MGNIAIELDENIEDKIIVFINEYKKDNSKNKFILDENHFKGIYVFLGTKPKNNPFPLGSFEDINIYLGGDE
jgi:hypothetical protein